MILKREFLEIDFFACQFKECYPLKVGPLSAPVGEGSGSVDPPSIISTPVHVPCLIKKFRL